MAKIVSRAEFAQIKEKLRADGKKIILCHAVFDLEHPEHFIHFEEASKMGDVLVVSITAAKYVKHCQWNSQSTSRQRCNHKGGQMLEAMETL